MGIRHGWAFVLAVVAVQSPGCDAASPAASAHEAIAPAQVGPGPAGWDRFQLIVWQSGRPAAALATMRRMGITAAALIADREHPDADVSPRLGPLRAAGLGYYLENTATDFFAPYHRWQPNLAINAAYGAVLARWRDAPNDPTVFWREPSLMDSAWRDRVARRLTTIARAQARHAPLFYDLGDETGIADLSAAWDFDRSPASLAAMRGWLAGQYASLDALNASWGTGFATWGAVVPDTTFQAMRRADGNYASWSDFKAWMDASFAAAIRAATDAVHAGDATALAGIEGGQMAGWGGYDYSRLAAAVDVMEIYGDATNVEVAGDMNPALLTLATIVAADPDAARATWRAALRGSRGVVLWDDPSALAHDDGAPGAAVARLAPVIASLGGPAGAALLSARPMHAPVAILYSQASFRARWMLDQRAGGDAWVTRGADGENDDNAWRAALGHASDQLLALGLRPLFVSPETLAAGVPDGIRVVVLPHSLALGDDTALVLAAFRARGGRVVADVAPGAYDAHLHPRAAPLDGLAERFDVLFRPSDPVTLAATRDRLRAMGVTAEIEVSETDATPAGAVEVRVFEGASGPLVGLLASGPARSLRLAWRGQGFSARELVTGASLGATLGGADAISVLVEPGRASLVALSRAGLR